MYKVWYCVVDSNGNKMWLFQAFGPYSKLAFTRLISLLSSGCQLWLEYKQVGGTIENRN
jgi:hypothetical protein